MKATIIKIGNSRGIRIPKTILEQCGFTDDVEFQVENKQLIVRPSSQPRADWENAFGMMASKGDDVLSSEDKDLSNDWDATEWEWK